MKSNASYVIIMEKGKTGYGAYVPDLPGCVAVGRTPALVRKLIREAIEMHLEDMRERGEKVPRPHSKVETVELSVA